MVDEHVSNLTITQEEIQETETAKPKFFFWRNLVIEQ